MYIIPVTSEPNQTFKCSIPINGMNMGLIFNLRYNIQAEYWAMTIMDVKTNEILIDSIPLLAGGYPAEGEGGDALDSERHKSEILNILISHLFYR